MDSETRKETVEKLLVSVPDYIQKVQCDTDRSTAPFKCAVRSCRNFFINFEERDKYTYKFHNFPCNKYLCEIWKERCGFTPAADILMLKVCSDHFSLDDYVRNYKEEFLNPDFKRKLKPDAVPQNNLDASTSRSDSIFFNEIKEAVGENATLRNKYESLLKAKHNAAKKIKVFKKKIAYRLTNLEKLHDALHKDSSSRNRRNVVRKVFSQTQLNLLRGENRVFWSDDDLAKAFTLRHIGSKECYLYLKNTLNMPLPALACVQKWAASYHSNP